MSMLRKSRHGFTLAEMIMAVAMLAFFSVFVVQLFAGAERFSRQAEHLDQAVRLASEWAEEWKRPSLNNTSAVILELAADRTPGTTFHQTLNDNFQVCPPEDAAFTATLTLQKPAMTAGGNSGASPDLLDLTIVITGISPNGNDPLYELTVSRYDPVEVAP